MVLNKMDRIITELKFTPYEAFLHLNKIVEQANAIMATFDIERQVLDDNRKYESVSQANSRATSRFI